MSPDECGCTVAKNGESFCIGFCPLHAAAAELLEALKGLLATASVSARGPAIGAARAAIAKAETPDA